MVQTSPSPAQESSSPPQRRPSATGSPWPSGQLTRPWKWFTRQMRLSHWNDRDSMFSCVTWNPANSPRYSSSGMHGSPMPPVSQDDGRIATDATTPTASTLDETDKTRRGVEIPLRSTLFRGIVNELLRQPVPQISRIERGDGPVGG